MSLKRTRYILIFAIKASRSKIFHKLLFENASFLVIFQLLNELSRMQSDHQEQSQRLQQEMAMRLQEKEHAIKAQQEQVNTDAHSRSDHCLA